MRITQLRSSAVKNGMIVKFNAENKLEPYDNAGTVAGIATNCREVAIQNDPEQPPANELVCELVISGPCDVLIDSASPSQGASFGASLTTVGSGAIGAEVKLGQTAPRGWSDTTEYPAGLVPALIFID